jgi:hypothetical protein
LQRLLVCECAARAGLEDFAGAATTAKAALVAAPPRARWPTSSGSGSASSPDRGRQGREPQERRGK